MYNVRAEAIYSPLHFLVAVVRKSLCASNVLRSRRALFEIDVCIHRDVIMMSLYFRLSFLSFQRIRAQTPESN